MLPPPSSRQRAPQRLQQQRVLVHRDAHAAAPALDHEHPLRAKPIGPALAPAPGPILAPAPGLVAGPGEQRDGARWAECLSLLLRRAPNASAGHCPRGCGEFVDPRPADRVNAYAQRGPSAWEAAR